MLTSVATLLDPRYKKSAFQDKEKAERSCEALIEFCVEEARRQSSKVLLPSPDTETVSTAANASIGTTQQVN